MYTEWKPIVLSRRQLAAAAAVLCALALLIAHFAAERMDIRHAVWRASRGTRFGLKALNWRLAGDKDPVLRALADRRINSGDRVEAVLSEYPDLLVDTCGRFQVLARNREGFPGWFIIARDGRLVSAQWGTNDAIVIFFEGLTPAESIEALSAQYAVRDRQFDDERAAFMAAAGPAGYIALYEPPSEPLP